MTWIAISTLDLAVELESLRKKKSRIVSQIHEYDTQIIELKLELERRSESARRVKLATQDSERLVLYDDDDDI